MNASTASTAAAAIIDAFKGEAAAAQGYVIAYVESARAVDNGESKASIAAAIKASGSVIKAGADLVGDFVLTAPLVAGDDGVAAAAWIRDKFGADSVKRIHTIVSTARAAKGQGTPVVKRITAPLVEMLASDEFDPDLYAAAVARAMAALVKIKPVKIDDTDTDTDDVEQDGADTDGPDTDDAPASFRARLDAVAPLIASLMKDYHEASDEDREAYKRMAWNMALPLRDAEAAA